MLSSKLDPSSSFIGGTSIPLKNVDDRLGAVASGLRGSSLKLERGEPVNEPSVSVSLDDATSVGASAKQKNGHVNRHSFILVRKVLVGHKD